VPRHPRDVLGPGAGFGKHRDDVPQRLAGLAGEVAMLEALFDAPADLASDEHLLAERCYAVRITARARPPGRLENVHLKSPCASGSVATCPSPCAEAPDGTRCDADICTARSTA